MTVRDTGQEAVDEIADAAIATEKKRKQQQESAEPEGQSDTDGGSVKVATSSPANNDFAEAPEDAERVVPERIADGFATYRVETVRSSGAFAMGDHAVSVGVTVEGPDGGPEVWSELSALHDAETYVATGADNALDRTLDRQHLGYLSGRDGTGRETAAAAALARRYGTDRIRRLLYTPGTRLSDLIRRSTWLTGGAGYLLHWPGPAEQHYLVELDALARRHHATVVAIGERADELGHFLVQHRTPDMAQVFGRHLSHALAGGESCLGGCTECRGECIEQYVRFCLSHRGLVDELSIMDEPWRATRLAAEIADRRPDAEGITTLLANGERPLRALAVDLLKPEPVGSLGDRKSADSPRAPADTYRRCFRIAYAVLSECPISMVAEAAAALLALMEPVAPETEDRKPIRRPWDNFGLSMDELVPEKMRGKRVDDPAVRGHSGRMAWIRVPELVGALLDVAWNDYPTSHECLLKWLEKLVDKGDPRRWVIRQRAALAAAFFAEFDLDRVMLNLFTKWAADSYAARRQAVGTGLARAARNPRLSARICEQVHDWAREQWSLHQDTALRAYWAGLATMLPARHVLNDLQSVALRPTQQANPMIGLAIASMAGPGTIDTIMSTLTEWCESGLDELASHAARATVELASRDSGAGSWPLLMGWATDGARRARLAALIRHAMLGPTMAERASAALGTWIVTADNDAAMSPILLEVLSRAWSDAVARTRARFHLHHLSYQDAPPGSVTAQVIQLLEEE